MRKLLLPLGALAVFVLLGRDATASMLAACPDPYALFQQYVAAVNAANVAGASAVFDEDADLSISDVSTSPHGTLGVARGIDEIRAFIQDQTSARTLITVLSGQTLADGSTAGGRFALRSTQVTAAGQDRIVFFFQLAEVAGVIGRVVSFPT